VNPNEVPDVLVEKAARAVRYSPYIGDTVAIARHALAAVLPEIQAQAWDEGYSTGNLDGYFGTSDEKNPHRPRHDRGADDVTADLKAKSWIGAPLTFWWDDDCGRRNEWCNYREPHRHGFACEAECPCKDQQRWHRRACTRCGRTLIPGRSALVTMLCQGHPTPTEEPK